MTESEKKYQDYVEEFLNNGKINNDDKSKINIEIDKYEVYLSFLLKRHFELEPKWLSPELFI